jgi:hypothetical protein
MENVTFQNSEEPLRMNTAGSGRETCQTVELLVTAQGLKTVINRSYKYIIA